MLFGLHPAKMLVPHSVVLVLFPYSFLLQELRAEAVPHTGDMEAV